MQYEITLNDSILDAATTVRPHLNVGRKQSKKQHFNSRSICFFFSRRLFLTQFVSLFQEKLSKNINAFANSGT